MNSVSYISRNRPLNYEDKVVAKKLGRPVPELNIIKTTASKSRQVNRYFKKENAYDKFSWMCGCPNKNKLFCFVCLLSNSLQSSPWIQQGVDDLQHLQERGIKHETSATHLHNLVDYNCLGKTDVRVQLDATYLASLRAHNETVDKNRHVLRRLIMCIKFCGAFRLAMLRHDEPDRSIFPGLVDFTSYLDSVLSIHLKEAAVFEEYTETILSDLLDAMLQVCRDDISDKISKSNFVAIEVDEATDWDDQQQLVIIFRYVFEGSIHERFWSFVRPEEYTAENIAKAVMDELDRLKIPTDKLIAQSYDGTSIMTGKITGVQSIIKEKYPYAYHVHCYAHQFDVILEKSASCNRKLRLFFAAIQFFALFFGSSRNIYHLEEIAKQKLPATWNFKTNTINTLYEQKELIRLILNMILDEENDTKTISDANALLEILNSDDFNYFLKIAHSITPYVEAFFERIESREADGLFIQNCLTTFESQVADIIQNEVFRFEPRGMVVEGPSGKVILCGPNSFNVNQIAAKEYCAEVLSQIQNRFAFTGHFSAAKLFLSESFPAYSKAFPEYYFAKTVTPYSCLIDKEKLKTELKVIYSREDMCCDGVFPLLRFISKNNLEDGLSETYKILDIICTTPMSTCESDRCFTTLKRIRCFLKNTTGQENFNALSMLSVEREMVQSIPDFDEKVIDLFVNGKERRLDFVYK